MTKFFAVDTLTNEVISGPHETRDIAAGICQDAFREHKNCEEDRYQVDESCSTEIVEIEPNIGDVDDDANYEAQLERLETIYSELESDTRYCVRVRRAQNGEASGTYYRRSNGNLQILGHSIEAPEDLRRLQESAWAKFCS
jgi:hypothetical protein